MINLLTSLLQQVGVTDEVSVCSCCGKENLKRTVVFETTDEWQAEGGDQYVFFGTSCAAKKRAIREGEPTKMKLASNGKAKRNDGKKVLRQFEVGSTYKSSFFQIAIVERKESKITYKEIRYGQPSKTMFTANTDVHDGVEFFKSYDKTICYA